MAIDNASLLSGSTAIVRCVLGLTIGTLSYKRAKEFDAKLLYRASLFIGIMGLLYYTTPKYLS